MLMVGKNIWQWNKKCGFIKTLTSAKVAPCPENKFICQRDESSEHNILLQILSEIKDGPTTLI
jgi:hypothetical protein